MPRTAQYKAAGPVGLSLIPSDFVLFTKLAHCGVGGRSLSAAVRDCMHVALDLAVKRGGGDVEAGLNALLAELDASSFD